MRIPIASIAYRYLIPLISLTILTCIFFIYLFPIFLLLTIFVAYFFRDPIRRPPDGKDLILSPADGRILDIGKVYEEHFIKGETIRVKIFLSVFDVHINRSPYGGSVPFQQHIPGRFIAAYKEEAPSENERNLIGVMTEYGKILVVQIAGKVARRIVSWINVGDLVEPGMPIGMIRFGSCTELYLPMEVAINVKVGDRVRGGETVLGKFQRKRAEINP
jgi:phosphatidylserine decarboxylase